LSNCACSMSRSSLLAFSFSPARRSCCKRNRHWQQKGKRHNL
jgi:hypothetical protein